MTRNTAGLEFRIFGAELEIFRAHRGQSAILTDPTKRASQYVLRNSTKPAGMPSPEAFQLHSKGKPCLLFMSMSA